MRLRDRACFALSRRLARAPSAHSAKSRAYGEWRSDSLSRSWSAFSDSCVMGKDVLDFGCGDGQLGLYLAGTKKPHRIVGVDLDNASIARARAKLANSATNAGVEVDFLVGTTNRLPVPDESFDTLLAFDCLEHVMSPESILHDWFRVLRPDGRCLIEWFPFKGPWGPHMESLIPIPWAHVIFGERAMFRAAEMIYDLPEFVPRHWDLDERGKKKPNKWRAWSSFEEQGYINQLDLGTFRKLAKEAGFEILREELHSFGGSRIRQVIGRTLMAIPYVGEYFVSFVIVELRRGSRSDDRR